MRDAILAETRLWLDTPYRHQASVCGVGCDCLGLVRGVWRALYGTEPEALPPYTPDWAERAGGETLLNGATRHLSARHLADRDDGDVLLFRMAPRAPIKHCAIQSGPDRIIHAYWARAVTETALTPWWRSRLAAVFAFPGVT